MHDLGIDGLAVGAQHGDFVGEETGLCHLEIIGGTVAALYQQLFIAPPRDHRNTAVLGQQCFVGLKRVRSFIPASVRLPSERTIIGNNRKCNQGTRVTRPRRASTFV